MASMIGSVIGTVINIILDPIFIFTLGFGAAGAAMATIIGYISTCTFFVFYILKKSKILSLSLNGFVPEFASLSEILVIGLPSSISNLMQTIGITLTNRFLMPYGNENIAVMGIVLKIVNIALLVLVGLAFGGQPIVGYNYGAKNMDRLKKTIRFGIAVTGGSGLFFTIVLSLFSKPVISRFLSDTELISLGSKMLRMQLLGMPLVGVCLIFICAFQSTGKALSAFILSACRQGIIYLPVIMITSKIFGLNGVISAQVISDIFTTVVAFFIFSNSLLKDIRSYGK